MRQDGFYVVSNAYERTVEDRKRNNIAILLSKRRQRIENKQRMWYAYEDRYVYSNSIYVKTLHKFYDYLSMENIIYTKSSIEEPPTLPYVY